MRIPSIDLYARISRKAVIKLLLLAVVGIGCGVAVICGKIATSNNALAHQAVQPQGFSFTNFSAVSGLALNGSAERLGSRLRLTHARTNQTGAVWYTEKQPVQDGFETLFQCQITEPFAGGADGFAFVIQNENAGAIGNRERAGSGIGYHGIPRSLAVEFDTWNNGPDGNGDPNDNHLSVHTRGTAPNSSIESRPENYTTAIPNLSDGNVHTIKILYEPGRLKVFVDDLSSPRLTVLTDITDIGLDAGKAFVGFTAATGDKYENHDVLSWEFVPVKPSLVITVTAPETLSLQNGQYPPFNVMAAVSNPGAETARGVIASIALPQGLSLRVAAPSVSLGDLRPGEMKSVTWQVTVDERRSDLTLVYSIVAGGANTDSHTVVKTVYLAPPNPPVLSLSTRTLDFCRVPEKAIKSLSFTISNSGGGTLRGSLVTNHPFGLTGSGVFTLAAGQSTRVTVNFTAIGIGYFSDDVFINSNGGNARLTMQAEGVEPVAVILAHGWRGSAASFSDNGRLYNKRLDGEDCTDIDPAERPPSCLPKMAHLLRDACLLIAQPFDYSNKTQFRCRAPVSYDCGWSIRQLAGELDKHIECVLAKRCIDLDIPGMQFPEEFKINRVDVVAHSMGGLITRSYIARLAMDRDNNDGFIAYNGKIRKLVTVGTPHYGLVWALQFPDLGLSAQEEAMEYGSKFILQLHDYWQMYAQAFINRGNLLTIVGTQAEGEDESTSDGFVNIASATLPIEYLDHQFIRYVPYRHAGAPILPVGGITLVGVGNTSHKTFQLVRQFLLDGSVAELHRPPEYITQKGLILLRVRDDRNAVLLPNLSLEGFSVNTNTSPYVNFKANTVTFWPLDTESPEHPTGVYMFTFNGALTPYHSQSFLRKVTNGQPRVSEVLLRRKFQ